MRMDVACAAVAALFLAAASPAAATFPGANGKIVFESSFRDGPDPEIYTIEPDGSGLTQLSANAVQDRYPSWSADGEKIAGVSERDGGGDLDVWYMNADGSGATQVTANAAEEHTPAWSPDGTRLAFPSDMSGDLEIWVIDLATSSLTQLTFHPGEDTSPAWSPDGTKIAWISQNGPRQVWTMNPDGSGQALVTSPGDHVDWAPDGSHLLFFELADTWRVNPTGSGLANITNTPGFWEDAPVYSPDMTRIAVPSNQFDPTWDLHLMNPDGSGVSVLDPSPGAVDFYPDWQPVGLRPGKGCGDTNHTHAREAQCKKLK